MIFTRPTLLPGTDHYARRVVSNGDAAVTGGGGALLRLSVTGHRDLASESEVATAIDGVLDRRLARGERPEVWSSLAEGADRLVTRRVLDRPDAELVAVLPLAADDYERDFDTEASRDEFRALLGRAVRHEVVGPDTDGRPHAEAACNFGSTPLRVAKVLIGISIPGLNSSLRSVP